MCISTPLTVDAGVNYTIGLSVLRSVHDSTIVSSLWLANTGLIRCLSVSHQQRKKGLAPLLEV